MLEYNIKKYKKRKYLTSKVFRLDPSNTTYGCHKHRQYIFSSSRSDRDTGRGRETPAVN